MTASPETPSITQGRWRIDAARSRLEFRASTLWGRVAVTGRFDRYDGSLYLQRDPAVVLTIDAASLNTGLRLRDHHLRSADFFDVASHPQVTFVSDSATLDGERLTVSGRLSAAGHSLPLQLEARVRRCGDELEVSASTRADHRKLGMSHGLLGMIPTPSTLSVHARLVR